MGSHFIRGGEFCLLNHAPGNPYWLYASVSLRFTPHLTHSACGLPVHRRHCEKGIDRMGPDLSHVTSSGRLPRLLIAENNLSTFEPLIRAFRDERLDIDFDVCTSHWSAVWKLLASPYQLIISGVHLAEMHDFLLLKRAQARQTFVPFVVTASASEKEVACRILKHGAFDLIPTPLDHEQTVNTIRLALWHNKFKALIASRDKALERYRQHIANYPGNRSGETFQTILTLLDQTVSAHERTIHRVEASMECLADLADNVEEQAREQALRRLDTFSR